MSTGSTRPDSAIGCTMADPHPAHNGEATEAGAYTLTGTSSVAAGNHPEHGANGRNANAKFFIPAENEWYKAAYYQPLVQGGDTDGYWLYPTQDNSPPVAESPPGGGSSANYNSTVFALTQVGPIRDRAAITGARPGWKRLGVDRGNHASARGLRGGSWASLRQPARFKLPRYRKSHGRGKRLGIPHRQSRHSRQRRRYGGPSNHRDIRHRVG